MDKNPLQTDKTPSALPTLEEVRRSPFCLDDFDAKKLKKRPRCIVTNEAFQPIFEDIPVKYIALPKLEWLGSICAKIPFVSAVVDLIGSVIVAVRMLKEMKKGNAVGLIDFGKHSGSLFCLLNSFKSFQSGPVIAHRVLLNDHRGPITTYFLTRALSSANLISVWSHKQIENYRRAFGCPTEKFIFIPYKANHSQTDALPMPVGDYIFSGGDSERDYKTLFDVARDLPIPVLISTRQPETLKKLEIPQNVILITAGEPAFERLMAGARVVAVCLKGDIIRGSGEATMLNAMWHRKPVVIADNISASDYIQDGVDGFVVPAGHAEKMRDCILKLWNDPDFSARMGEAGRAKVSRLYTHGQFKARMQALSLLLFENSQPAE